MQPAKYWEIVWYLAGVSAKHRIVYDKLATFECHIADLLKDEDVTSFYVTTHRTMPKEA